MGGVGEGFGRVWEALGRSWVLSGLFFAVFAGGRCFLLLFIVFWLISEAFVGLCWAVLGFAGLAGLSWALLAFAVLCWFWLLGAVSQPFLVPLAFPNIFFFGLVVKHLEKILKRIALPVHC